MRGKVGPGPWSDSQDGRTRVPEASTHRNPYGESETVGVKGVDDTLSLLYV